MRVVLCIEWAGKLFFTSISPKKHNKKRVAVRLPFSRDDRIRTCDHTPPRRKTACKMISHVYDNEEVIDFKSL